MSSPTSSFSLIERAKGGDRDSLSQLFEKHQRRVFVLAYFKLAPQSRRPEDIEDIVQETMLRAYRDVEQFTYRSPGSFLKWLSSILDHVIIDRARHSGRAMRTGEQVRFRSPSNPAGPDPLDSNTPSRVLAQQEGIDRLIATLDKLPEDYRAVILMAKMEGLSTAEIAERLGKSREAVALLVYRAVKRLRSLLEAAGS